MDIITLGISKPSKKFFEIENQSVPPLHTQGDLDYDGPSCKCQQLNPMFTSRKLECKCKQEVKVITQKQTRKTIQANLWLANNHPLNIETFLPLLHVLSFSSMQVRKLSRYLSKYQLPKDKFPLRAKIPLFFFMEATFHFENLTFTGNTRPRKGFVAIKQSEDVFLID